MTEGTSTNGTTISPTETIHHKTWPKLPSWAEHNSRKSWGGRLNILEWEGSDQQTVDSYRQNHGWKGSDLVHSISSPVRILEYRVQYPTLVVPLPLTGIQGQVQAQEIQGQGQVQGQGEGTILTGMVHFTAKSESHQGFCHGGSMTSIMDDAIGWIGFCVTGECRPWTGFTVQVNTSLKKPVQVGKILMIRAVIDKVERRKVFAKVELVDPGVCVVHDNDDHDHDDGREEVLYATGEGLVIVNHGVINGH